jgi:hypothetical protein
VKSLCQLKGLRAEGFLLANDGEILSDEQALEGVPGFFGSSYL